ncbi:MAG: hypothetical protein R2883_06900 [Caldisericia bacterium]
MLRKTYVIDGHPTVADYPTLIEEDGKMFVSIGTFTSIGINSNYIDENTLELSFTGAISKPFEKTSKQSRYRQPQTSKAARKISASDERTGKYRILRSEKAPKR